MKRKFIGVLAVITFLATMLTGCGSRGGLKEITLNELAHSIFYAPMYVAFEKLLEHVGEEDKPKIKKILRKTCSDRHFVIGRNARARCLFF